jgi:hypothetical protein
LLDVEGDEPDGLDETWCLYDGQQIDDERYHLWAEFKREVRILIVADTCHAGTPAKVEQRLVPSLVSALREGRPKHITEKCCMETQKKNPDLYKRLIKIARKGKPSPLNAAVRWLSACEDWEVAMDGDVNGLFTANLLTAWSEGQFEGNYRKFHSKIKKLMDGEFQTPVHDCLEPDDPVYANQKPFTI